MYAVRSSRPRSRSSGSPTGPPASPTASTPCSGPGAPRCPPARSSWSRSRACWCATCRSSCSTRRRRAWTPSPRLGSCRPPTGCWRAGRVCWSPTGSRRRPAPSRWRSWRPGGSSSTALGSTWPARPDRSATLLEAAAEHSRAGHLRDRPPGRHRPPVDDASSPAPAGRRAQPGPRHVVGPDGPAEVGPGRHAAVPDRRHDRGVRRADRAGCGDCWSRTSRVAAARCCSPSPWSSR